jgi:hypothetical protein
MGGAGRKRLQLSDELKAYALKNTVLGFILMLTKFFV